MPRGKAQTEFVTQTEQVMACGDIVTARQDLRDAAIWYIEIYKQGEQTECMRVEVTSNNCNRLFALLRQEKPEPAKSWRFHGTEELPFYKLHRRGY